MIEMEDLDTCPFCGCNRHEIYVNPFKKAYIKCANCEARIECSCMNTDTPTIKYVEYLIEKWNTRKTEEQYWEGD